MSQWLLYMRNQVICIIKNWLHFLLIWSPFSQVIFTFCMLMQLLFLLYIWFIFPGWWLRKLATLSADTRHDTSISDTNTGQCFVLLCYLLPFTYFREESICLHRSDFVIWIFSHFLYFFLSVDCGFFVLYGNLLHSANIKQLHSYPVRFTWSMSFMLHADFSLQNKQQLFPSSSELPGSHSLYGAPPVCYCMLLWLASAYISL